MNRTENQMDEKLQQLCDRVRSLCEERDYAPCFELIDKAMYDFPHSATPHNLMGVVLEKTGDHLSAMKHFRAAWALDSTDLATNQNLHTYGTFYSKGKAAFDDSDVVTVKEKPLKLVYEGGNITRAVTKNQIEYDSKGIGVVARRSKI